MCAHIIYTYIEACVYTQLPMLPMSQSYTAINI